MLDLEPPIKNSKICVRVSVCYDIVVFTTALVRYRELQVSKRQQAWHKTRASGAVRLNNQVQRGADGHPRPVCRTAGWNLVERILTLMTTASFFDDVSKRPDG